MGSIIKFDKFNIGIFNDVYSDYAFFERVYKNAYIMNSRKTSLKLKHQKNKVIIRKLKSITLPIVVDGKVLEQQL
jgi:hypothetical protein